MCRRGKCCCCLSQRAGAALADLFLFLMCIKDVIEIWTVRVPKGSVVLILDVLDVMGHTCLFFLLAIAVLRRNLWCLKAWIMIFPLVIAGDIFDDFFILKEIYEGKRVWENALLNVANTSVYSSTANIVVLFIASISACKYFDELDEMVNTEREGDPWAQAVFLSRRRLSPRRELWGVAHISAASQIGSRSQVRPRWRLMFTIDQQIAGFIKTFFPRRGSMKWRRELKKITWFFSNNILPRSLQENCTLEMPLVLINDHVE